MVEGIYEFTLPEGAIITDLVLWIGDKRVQGIIMEKEAARRVYDAIVRRRIDPALIEQVTANQFRLSGSPRSPGPTITAPRSSSSTKRCRPGRTSP